ncbi:MAG TPA: multicopper oxidase family protein [Gemmatimonadales bacterium]|nr:multicopper oxidase family protein [Gemmatimonadales bacterium]
MTAPPGLFAPKAGALIRACLVILMVTGPVRSAGAQRPCDPPEPLGPSPDLYCIELVPAPGIRGISGRVELGHIPGPFSIAVTADGRIRYGLRLIAAGLPSPGSLGAFRTYVAWAATPTMDSVARLGEVRNGRTRLGDVDLEKFTILVTAESSAAATVPGRKVVLRGQSPGTRLFPPDFLQLSIGSMTPSRHSGHGGVAPDSAGGHWTMVPMAPGLTMLPAEMALRPDVTPYLPSADGPEVRRGQRVQLRNGDTLRLDAGVVRRTIGGRSYSMFAFNGQQPGPLIEVARGAGATVIFTNRLPQPTTVHWHGLRLDSRNDGVPGLAQTAVSPGEVFTYRLRFPDAGIYWYHPHVREDVQQELGLYGNILVRHGDAEDSSAVHREVVLMLDDLLVGEDGPVPLGRESPTHALMGRFGNRLMVNGEPGYRLEVRRGEVVRFYLTNAANARTMNLSFPGARMKVVASDVGEYAREAWVESVVIAPAERYVVDVRFERSGRVPLVNRVRGLDHVFGRFFYEADTLGTVAVSQRRIGPDLGRSFTRLRSDPAVRMELDRYRRLAERAPSRTLILALETSNLPPFTQRIMQLDSIYFPPVEWSGTMAMMNWASTGRQVRWILRDAETGRENMDIDWRFSRGEPVRIRLVNRRESVHAMQHPIHMHGQRFLVLAVNGEPNDNFVWKDTVLVPAGGVVDILLDPSNPGRWMGHCHIAEHLSAGMMMGFTVQ